MRLVPKTLLIAVILSCLLAVNAYAADFCIGFKGGLGLTSIYGDYGDEYENKTGITGGAFVTVYFMDFLGIQAEALYARKGASFEAYDYEYGDLGSADYNLDYLEVTFLPKVRVPLGESFAPTFFLGGSIALNIASGWTYEGETTDVDCVSDSDICIITGFGVDIMADALLLTLDVRYTMGLLNVHDEECIEDELDGYEYDIPENRNHGLVFMAGVGFTL